MLTQLREKQQADLTDKELILACRQGNGRSWNQVVKKYERLIYSIPLNYGLSRDDAADIAQLTFTILIQSLDSLRDDSHLGAWLSTVARRHTWRLIERRRRESPVAEDDLVDSLILPDHSDQQSRERADLLEWLNQGLSLIGERCRTLLLALYFDDEEPSYADIAHRLQMRVGSVGPTRARCLARLRERLEDE